MKNVKFDVDVTVEDILSSCGIRLAPGRNYFDKEFRNQQSVGEFVCSVRIALDAMRSEIRKASKQATEMSVKRSEAESRATKALEEVTSLTRTAIARGLEATDIPPATRERIVNLNGS